MTSRERIKKFLAGEKVDRIPNGLMGCETASIHMLGYDTIKKVLGVNDETNRMFSFMFNAVPEPEFLQKAECDIIPLSTKLCPAPMWKDVEKNWKIIKLFGLDASVPKQYEFVERADGSTLWKDAGWYAPKGSLYFDPLPTDGSDIDIDEITAEDFAPALELTEEYLRGLEEQAKILYETTDYALSIGETIFDLQVAPGGYVNHFMYMRLYPERMREFLEKSIAASKRQIVQVNQAVGKYCLIMCLAHDFGDNNGVMIGPELWRDIYKPFYQDLFSFWHANTDMKINLHSCGSIDGILPDLIECGVDILNPIQLTARNMDAQHLRKRYGGKVIFYGGGYDAVACYGKSEEEVYNSCLRNLRELSRGGGYIFAGIHNIPGDVTEAHFRAMLRAYNDVKFDKDLL